MSWDALQRDALVELGLTLWAPHVPGSEPPLLPDPRVLAVLAKAAGMSPQALTEAGLSLPGFERLREASVKRALWPMLRGLRDRA